MGGVREQRERNGGRKGGRGEGGKEGRRRERDVCVWGGGGGGGGDIKKERERERERGERERDAGEQVLKVLNYRLHVLKLHHILITAHLSPCCLYRLDTLNQLPTLQCPQTPGQLTLC